MPLRPETSSVLATRSAPSRRTVVTAAAWTAPAIAVAAAAPLAAASTSTVVVSAVSPSYTSYAGELVSISFLVTSAGTPVASTTVSFGVTTGAATLSVANAVTDASGVVSVAVTPTSATSTVTVTASVATSSGNATVVVPRPLTTITPTSGVDAAAATTFTISGRGFIGTPADATAPGNAYSFGAYVTLWNAADWNDEEPLAFDYLAVRFVPAALLRIQPDGSFSGLTFPVAAGTLAAGSSYAIALSAAHQYSAFPRFNSHATFTTA